MEGADRRSIWDRMRGAAKLEVETYEEVEHDRTATGQAAAVVAMTAVAQAIGAADGGIAHVIGAAVAALVGWLLWAGVTYLVGARLFGGTATWGQLLRTLGFAQAPKVLSVFALVPMAGWLIEALLFFWVLVAGIIAIRQALDFGTGRAVLTALVGGFFVAALQVVLTLM